MRELADRLDNPEQDDDLEALRWEAAAHIRNLEAQIRSLEGKVEYYEVQTHEQQQEIECLHEEIGEVPMSDVSDRIDRAFDQKLNALNGKLQRLSNDLVAQAERIDHCFCHIDREIENLRVQLDSHREDTGGHTHYPRHDITNLRERLESHIAEKDSAYHQLAKRVDTSEQHIATLMCHADDVERMRDDITNLHNRVIDLERGAQPEPSPDPLEQTREVCGIFGWATDRWPKCIHNDRTEMKMHEAIYEKRMMEWLDEKKTSWYISSNDGLFVVNTPGGWFIEAPTRREALEAAVLAVAKGE